MEIFIQNYKKPEGLSVVVTARPLKNPAGAITGGVLVIHDITERKNSETEIKKLNEEQIGRASCRERVSSPV